MAWKGYSKFKAVRVGNFASKLEAAVHGILLNRQDAGEITDIKCQQHVELTKAKVKYIADFSCVDVKTGETIWVEAKGAELGPWRLKKRLWSFYGPGPLLIYKGSHARPYLAEELIPKQKASTCHGCGVQLKVE